MGDIYTASNRPFLLLPEDHLRWTFSRPPFFPPAVVGWKHSPLALRERAMLWFINEVTDHPEWRTAVTDESAVAAWREAMVHPDPTREPGLKASQPGAATKHPEIPGLAFTSLPPDLAATGFTSAMFDACIAELRAKAAACEAQGNDAVRIFDVDAAVYKQTLPEAFTAKTRVRLGPLEKESREGGDYRADHGKVLLSLVHPALFPLVYGRTTALAADMLTRDNCLSAMGKGNVIGQLGIGDLRSRKEYRTIASVQHSWLPTDVEVIDGKCHLVSYVNNLHPERHAAVYDMIEQVIEAALPSFVAVIQAVKNTRLGPQLEGTRRIPWLMPYNLWSCLSPETCRGNCNVQTHVSRKGVPPNCQPVLYGRNTDLEVFRRNHPAAQPEPLDPVQVVPLQDIREGLAAVGLGDPAVDRLQVIVTINNHYLTPENPSYAGGRWHREGMRNEHIVASAIYYYDIENITPSRLSFRAAQSEREPDADNLGRYSLNGVEIMEQNRGERTHARDRIYGKASSHVPLGSTLSVTGRLVVFPNVLDHKVEPFELADKTRPGHRKAIGIFLVDPALRIPSTSRVPPQQLHWAGEGSILHAVSENLPPEIAQQVHEELACPYDLTVAGRIRAEMLRERKRVREQIPDKDMEISEEEESDDDMS